jgi:Zn-dependent protease with chaperone function
MQLILHSGLLTSLGWSLLNSFWQMGLLWLLYSLVTLSPNRLTAAARHNLAFILLAFGAGWFLAGFFDRDQLLSAALFSGGFPAGLSVLAASIDQVLPYFSFIYLATLVLMGLRGFSRHWQIRKSQRDTLSVFTAQEHFTKDMSRRVGIKRQVRLFLSSAISVPQTMGFIKPVILFPVALLNHLSTEQVESILVHELVHIRRNDYLLNICLSLVKTVFFFNPFARLFIRNIQKEREHACDDEVMTCSYSAHLYGSALLMLERTRQQTVPLSLAADGKNDKLLLERVKRVTGHLPQGRRTFHPLLFLGVMIAMLPFATSPTAGQSDPALKPIHGHQAAASFTVFHPAVLPVAPMIVRVEWKTITPKEKHLKKVFLRQMINPLAALAPASPEADPYEVRFAGQPNRRNFSNESSVSVQAPETIVTGNAPYVPSASFYYQSATDTLKPAEQEALLQLQNLKKLAETDMQASEAREKVEGALNLRLAELKQLEAQKELLLRKARQNNRVILEQSRKTLQERKLEIQRMQEKLKKIAAEGIIYI